MDPQVKFKYLHHMMSGRWICELKYFTDTILIQTQTYRATALMGEWKATSLGLLCCMIVFFIGCSSHMK